MSGFTIKQRSYQTTFIIHTKRSSLSELVNLTKEWGLNNKKKPYKEAIDENVLEFLKLLIEIDKELEYSSIRNKEKI